jgi:PAS domain S-box-containing protein
MLEGEELQEIQDAGTYGRGNCASGAEFKATPWTIQENNHMGSQVMSTVIDGKNSDFLIKKLYLSEFDWTLVATANLSSVSHARWIAMTITFLSLLAMTLGGLYWRQREKRVSDLRKAGALLEQRVQDRTRDLAERDAFRKAMEDALLVGMRARDLEGRITYVNPALCDITGFSTEEMLDKSPPYVYWYPDETEPHVKAGPVLPNESATLHGYDTRFRHKDGHEIFVTIYDAPLIDANGHHSGWMSSIVDISVQKQMESRQRVQDEQLRQVQRRAVIEEMASTLAHEISQPLMIIGASNEAAKLFIDQGNMASLKNSLEMIALQKQRAANIIKTIRDHTRMKTKGDELCNVNDIVDGVTVFLRAEVRRRKAHISKSFATNLPLVVADRVLLEQVLVNLVINGLQAMQDNPVNQRLIEIETVVADEYVSVRVHDLGPGVSPEVAGNLFKSFFTTKEDGLGMGLNICRTIIESHGGQLAFENRPERGTTFYFSIPSNP